MDTLEEDQMTAWTSHDAPHSLASAPQGEEFRVVDVIFEHVRAHCRQLGIEKEDNVRCLERTANGVRVGRRDGPDVLVPWDYAYFVRLDSQRAPIPTELPRRDRPVRRVAGTI